MKSIKLIAFLLLGAYASAQSLSDPPHNKFETSPNPVQHIMKIEVGGQNGEITIFDILGNVVISNKIENNYLMDCSMMLDGIYFVRFIDENKQISTKRILIRH